MKRKKILILGATGMLGSAIYGQFKNKYNLILGVKNPANIKLLEKQYGKIGDHQCLKLNFPSLENLEDADYVINCVGIIIPYVQKDLRETFFINTALPHLLSQKYGSKLIHITTDCVFDGKTGFPYTEISPKNSVDLYGLSKSLGEPSNSLVLRTSIIGRELKSYMGLLEWFLHQKGKIVYGYANHLWNGITTVEFAKICDKIIDNPGKYPRSGIFHIFSDVISKYDMLVSFQEKYQVDCTLKKDKIAFTNRTLASIYPLCQQLKIPSFKTMLKQLL